MIVQIPFTHTLDIDANRLIQHCDSTQLNEIILLASKKLDLLEQTEHEDLSDFRSNYKIDAL